MRLVTMVLSTAFVLASLSPSPGADKPLPPTVKSPELRQIRPRKPVKIKLKRTAKEDYSWELSGDDADEIVRIDRKLRKLLNVP